MDDAGYEQKTTSAVGAELRAARETQGLGLGDVATRTRIPQRHLEAIEASNFASLPAATYSTGFVRTYARLLGLDAGDLSQRFRAELSESLPTNNAWQEAYEPADPARVPSRGLVWAMVALAVVLGLGYLYWRGSQIENPTQVVLAPAPATQAAAAAAAPGLTQAPVSPAASPDVAPAANGVAVLTAQEAVWLRITDGTTKLYQGVLNPGDHFEVPATAADPRLRTSRATALKVTVGATTIPALGPAETLIKNVSLKPADLLARANGAAASAQPGPSVGGPATG